MRRYLRFVDNTTLPKRGEDVYDKLGKIRPITDIINAKMIDSYTPHKENSIDKAMITFTCLFWSNMSLRNHLEEASKHG